MARSSTSKPRPPSSTSSTERRASARTRRPSAKARSPPLVRVSRTNKTKGTAKKSTTRGKGREDDDLAATLIGSVASLALRRDDSDLSRGTSHSAVHSLVQKRTTSTGTNLRDDMVDVKRQLLDEQILVYGKAGSSAVTLSEEAWAELREYKEEDAADSQDDEQAARQFLDNNPLPSPRTAKSTSSRPSRRKSSRSRKRVRAPSSEESDADEGDQASSSARAKGLRAAHSAATTKTKRSRSRKRVKVIVRRDGGEEVDELATDEEQQPSKVKPKKTRKKREPKTGSLPRWKKDELIDEVQELRKKLAELEEEQSEDDGEEERPSENQVEDEMEVVEIGKGKKKKEEAAEAPPGPEEHAAFAVAFKELQSKYRRIKDKHRAFEPVPYSDDEDPGEEDFSTWANQQQQQGEDVGENVDFGGMDDFFDNNPMENFFRDGEGADHRERQDPPSGATDAHGHQGNAKIKEKPDVWLELPPDKSPRGKKGRAASRSASAPNTTSKKQQLSPIEGDEGAAALDHHDGQTEGTGAPSGMHGAGFDSPMYPHLDLDGESAQHEYDGNPASSSPFQSKGKDRQTSPFRFSSASPFQPRNASSSPTKSFTQLGAMNPSSSRQATTEPSSPVIGGFSSTGAADLFGASGHAHKVAELQRQLQDQKMQMMELQHSRAAGEKVIAGYKDEVDLLVLRSQDLEASNRAADTLNILAAQKLIILEAALRGAGRTLERESTARVEAEVKEKETVRKLEQSEADYDALLASEGEVQEARLRTQRENAELKKQLLDRAASVEQLSAKVISLEDELRKSCERLESIESATSSDLTSAAATETELRETLELRTKELAAERDIAREAMMHRDEAAKKVDDLEKQMVEQMKEREEALEELARAKEALAAEHSKMERAEENASTSSIEIARLKARLEEQEDVRRKAEETAVQHSETIKTLQVELDSCKIRLEEVTSAFDKLKESESDLRKRDQENGAQLESLDELVASLSREKAEAGQACKAISDELESLKTAHALLTSRLQDLATTFEIPLRPLDNGSTADTLLSVLDELTSRLEKSEEAASAAAFSSNEEVKKKDEELEAVRQEVDIVRDELKTVEEKMAVAYEALKEQVDRLAQVCGIVQSGDGNLELAEVVDAAATLLASKAQEIQELQHKAQEVEETVAVEAVAKQEMKRTISTLEASIIDLKTSVSTLELSIAAKEQSIRRIAEVVVQESQEEGEPTSQAQQTVTVEEA
ncbi:hypothetical protein JCM11251_000332 [Rhodosporidiobolus azoricus]